MAKRYSPSEKKKRLREVSKLLDEGISLGSACEQVANRHVGRPSKGTLSIWWSKESVQQKTSRPGTARRAAEKPGRDEQGGPVPTASAEPVEHADPSIPAQPGSDGSDGVALGPAAAAADSGPESSQSSPAGAAVNAESFMAEVVQVTSGRAANPDLVEENQRLRVALNEANREIRAMRDLLVVYASR